MRVAVASVVQETNTFSAAKCRLEDFDWAEGAAAGEVRGVNSEMAGVLEVLEEAGVEAVPLLRAWAMPSGPLTAEAFGAVREALAAGAARAGRCGGMVLSIHGAMAADGFPDADGQIISEVRRALGPETPLVISLDLHANLTSRMVELVDGLSAFHTDPHVDMAEAGRRAARMLLEILDGAALSIGLAKRPMLVPAETMNTETGPLAAVRAEAMAEAPPDLVDLCLFPVQPWLDVPELGLGVAAVVRGGRRGAQAFAERTADRIWARRGEFVMRNFLPPAQAVSAAAASRVRPFLLAQSADAPTAGAGGDSPAMIEPLLRAAPLVSYLTVVDPAAAARSRRAGEGAEVSLRAGAGIDGRWHPPVEVTGRVLRTGAGSYRLEGVGFHGMEVQMGRFAVLAVDNLRLLVSERPAWSSDPAAFRFAGLPPEEADIIVVKSCSDFRPNFPDSSPHAVTVDTPGAASPRLERLIFRNAPRPLWPLDRF